MTGLCPVALQDQGTKGTSFGIVIPTLSTTRARIIPGSSRPGRGSQGTSDANPREFQLWLELSGRKNREGQKPSRASNLALEHKHFQRRTRERMGAAGAEGYIL